MNRYNVTFYYLATGMDGIASEKDYGIIPANSNSEAKDKVLINIGKFGCSFTKSCLTARLVCAEPILELIEEPPVEIVDTKVELVYPELTALYERHAKLRELKKMVEGIVRDCTEDIAEYEKEMAEIVASSQEFL